jgi:hypothetical protein
MLFGTLQACILKVAEPQSLANTNDGADHEQQPVTLMAVAFC